MGNSHGGSFAGSPRSTAKAQATDNSHNNHNNPLVTPRTPSAAAGGGGGGGKSATAAQNGIGRSNNNNSNMESSLGWSSSFDGPVIGPGSAMESFSVNTDTRGDWDGQQHQHQRPRPQTFAPHPPANASPGSNSSPRARREQQQQLALFPATTPPKNTERNTSNRNSNTNNTSMAGSSTGALASSERGSSNLIDMLSLNDCSISASLQRVNSLNRGGGDGNGPNAAGASSEKDAVPPRPPVSMEEARDLFEVLFSPVTEGTMECIQSGFLTRELYGNLAEFFNPFLGDDPYKKKWYVDNTMRVVIGRERWRSSRELEITSTPTREQTRLLVQLRKDYTDMLRDMLLEMADVLDGPVHRRKQVSLRDQVALFNASKEAARAAGGGRQAGATTAAGGNGGYSASPSSSDRLGRPIGSPAPVTPNALAGVGSAFSTSLPQGTGYDVIMARLLHASSTSYDCYHLLASRMQRNFFSGVGNTEYWSVLTPVVWPEVGCFYMTAAQVAAQNFFVPLSKRVELLQAWGARRAQDSAVGKLSTRGDGASSGRLSNSSSGGEMLIDSPSSLFSAVRNMALVLTTACSSLVLQVLIDLADAIKMRQNFRSLKARAKEQHMRLEDLIGKDAMPKRHYTGDAGNDINEWKEFVMAEEMTLPVLTKLLVQRFHEKPASKEREARLAKEFWVLFTVLERGLGNQKCLPTAAIGSLVLKLMFLIGGGQRSIQADDRRVPSGSRQSTDDLSLAHMLDVPVLNYICWVACMLGMPVMAPKGSLLRKRHERPLNFIEADEIAGVMRVLFQEVGALPPGNECPTAFSAWLPLFPLYAVNTEGKRTLMYLYSVQACATKPLPLVIQKDMVLQSYAAIITEHVNGFERALPAKRSSRAGQLGPGAKAPIGAEKLPEREALRDCFDPDRVTSYLFQPTMTAGYAKMQSDTKGKKKKKQSKQTSSSGGGVAKPVELSKIRAAGGGGGGGTAMGNSSRAGGNNSLSSPSRSSSTSLRRGVTGPAAAKSSAVVVVPEDDKNDPREPMNYQFDGPNVLFEMGSSASSGEEESNESNPLENNNLANGASRPGTGAAAVAQPLTAKAIAAIQGQRTPPPNLPYSKGTPGVTEDDNGSDSSDGNSSCSTLLDANMNIDAYTCVSPAAQLYLRCANEAIVKRHKSTELTPFVTTELYRNMSALKAHKPDVHADIQKHLQALSVRRHRNEVRGHAGDAVLILRWTSAEPMVTFQPGDLLSITVERPSGNNGSFKYFNNISRRGSSVIATANEEEPHVGSRYMNGNHVNHGKHSNNNNIVGVGILSPPPPGAPHGSRVTRRHSVTIDAVDPDGNGGGGTRAMKRAGKAGGGGGSGGAVPLSSSEVGQGGYWRAVTHELDEDASSFMDNGSSIGSTEERLRHATSVQLTVRSTSDPALMRQCKRGNEVIMLVKASTTELPDVCKILSIGHERANMSPFYYMEGDISMCWTNTRLIASIVAGANAQRESPFGSNGSEDGGTGNDLLQVHPGGYTKEELKRMFYSIGVLLGNAIINAVFFSVPLAPLCFWLFKKAAQTGDHTFASFSWLEPSHGNLLSPAMVLNNAYDILNLSDRKYLDFLHVRGLTKPEKLTFPLVKRDVVSVPKAPTTTTNASITSLRQRAGSEENYGSPSPSTSARLSGSRVSAHTSENGSSRSGSLRNHPSDAVPIKEYLRIIDFYNNHGGPSRLRAGTSTSSNNIGNHQQRHLRSDSGDGNSSMTTILPQDAAQVRKALESLPSREDYISLYLVNEIAWSMASRDYLGTDVKELWGWMAKGFATSPIAHSPLMTHCCSRVIREVLCMPISGKKYTNEG